MYVEENQYVTKGTLLVEINDGRDDTEFREGLYGFKKAEADLVYKQAFFERQQALYAGQQISKDAFEKARQDFVASCFLAPQIVDIAVSYERMSGVK